MPAVALVGLQLVIDLPAHHGGLVGIVQGHFLGDAVRIAQKHRVRHAAVAADAQPGGGAVLLHMDDLRVLFIQTHGRAAGGGAQHHLHAAGGKEGDGLIQPGKIELALPGLQAAPGKLRQTNQLYAGGQHPVRIFFPEGAIPVLRVVGNADLHVG